MKTGCYYDKPGGLCTAWMRKGFTIDGCVADSVKDHYMKNQEKPKEEWK